MQGGEEEGEGDGVRSERLGGSGRREGEGVGVVRGGGGKSGVVRVRCARHHVVRYRPYVERVEAAEPGAEGVFVCKGEFRCSEESVALDPFGYALEREIARVKEEKGLRFVCSEHVRAETGRGEGEKPRRPLLGAGKVVFQLKPRPGSWYCSASQCGELNMSACYWCFYCNTARSSQSRVIPWDPSKKDFPGKIGDWVCLACRKMNFQFERHQDESGELRKITKCAFCRTLKSDESPVIQ